MKIAISARALSLPYGGVREYVEALIRELLITGARHQFSIYYADQRWLGTHPTADEVYLRAPHKFLWDHAVLPLRLAHDRPDVVWFPHNVSSLGLHLPTVVTVYDLLYFRMPEVQEREYAMLDSLYMRAFIPPSAHRARRVAVISEWTARDMTRLLGLPPERMATIYPAAASDFAPAGAEVQQRIRGTFDLRRPFFFYAGTLSPRKNVRALVEAFARVSGDLPHDLVLTGGPGYIETPIDDLVTRYGLAGRVRRIGLAPRASLPALYGAAEALVFPSRYEGFGIPPLEAMACGCPVICSSATSLPEVVGDAALTFAPDDVAMLATHLRDVATDPALRARLVRQGLARSRHFRYADAASRLLELIEEAAS